MPIHVEHDTVMANPSMHLSVTLWYCIKMNAHIIKHFLPSDRDMGMTRFLSATAITKFKVELIQLGR